MAIFHQENLEVGTAVCIVLKDGVNVGLDTGKIFVKESLSTPYLE